MARDRDLILCVVRRDRRHCASGTDESRTRIDCDSYA